MRSERATDWEFVDGTGEDKIDDMPVHVLNHVRINGEKAPIHFHRTEPVYVHAGARAATYVSIVVLPEDVTYMEGDGGEQVPDTVGGIPVLTAAADDVEYVWHKIITDRPEAPRPNGAHYPRDHGEPVTEWLRIWVLARSVNFRYARPGD